MNRSYELMLIFQKEFAETEIKAVLERIKKSLKTGKVISSVELGIKHFSYPIRKETEGNYWLLNLQGEPREVKELENILKIDLKILRYLLTKTSNIKEK